jgi:hypothetical protein
MLLRQLHNCQPGLRVPQRARRNANAGSPRMHGRHHDLQLARLDPP